MRDLFPIIDPVEQKEVPLPLYKTVAWDFRDEHPIFENGNPVYVLGKEGVRVWAWLALKTARTLYEIYSWDFGSELETLIGKSYTKSSRHAEAIRYTREALEGSPYIVGIRKIDVSFDNGTLHVSAEVTTIYGEVTVYV